MNEIDEEKKQPEEAAAEDAAEQDEEPKKPFSDALDWVSSIVYAVAAMLVLNLFFLRSITVSGPSMLDTLQDGDRVVATNFFYTPDYGDIVIIQANKLMNDDTNMWGEPIIKRVIAVEGDTVMIDFDKGEGYRNGELLHEDYIKDLTFFRHNDTWMESGVSYDVPEDCVFVLGDNRPVSNDSRNLPQVGFINKDMIMGKAFVRVSPIKNFKWL
ncbi:MAG: signal peptidase I [Lachnospiraceae bacterium]|nr:signal peptidase I [Ruminococcus sp.]MCM1275870.1 signal peptidase I [Lachnospiraceae bacterium]